MNYNGMNMAGTGGRPVAGYRFSEGQYVFGRSNRGFGGRRQIIPLGISTPHTNRIAPADIPGYNNSEAEELSWYPGAHGWYVGTAYDPGPSGYRHGLKGPGMHGLHYHYGKLPRRPSFITAWGRRMPPWRTPGDHLYRIDRDAEGFIGGVGPQRSLKSQRMSYLSVLPPLFVVGVICALVMIIFGGIFLDRVFGNRYVLMVVWRLRTVRSKYRCKIIIK